MALQKHFAKIVLFQVVIWALGTALLKIIYLKYCRYEMENCLTFYYLIFEQQIQATRR